MNTLPIGQNIKSKTPCLDKIRGLHKDAEPSEVEFAFEKRLNDVVNCIVETITFPMFLTFLKKEQQEINMLRAQA